MVRDGQILVASDSQRRFLSGYGYKQIEFLSKMYIDHFNVRVTIFRGYRNRLFSIYLFYVYCIYTIFDPFQ